jgi:hypothetical protein
MPHPVLAGDILQAPQRPAAHAFALPVIGHRHGHFRAVAAGGAKAETGNRQTARQDADTGISCSPNSSFSHATII